MMTEEGVLTAVLRRYYIFISLFLLSSGLVCGHLAEIRIGYGLDSWIEKSGVNWRQYQDLQKKLGDPRTLQPVFELKALTPERVPPYLELLAQLRGAAGVQAVIDPVALYLLNTDKTALDTKAITDLWLSFSMQPSDYRNWLVAQDLQTIAPLILCDPEQPEQHPLILQQLQAGLEALNMPYRLSGNVHFSAALSAAINRELGLIITGLISIAWIILTVFLHDWKLPACILLGIVLSACCALALATWLGIRFSLMTLTVFPLLFCLGLTTAAHLFIRSPPGGYWQLNNVYPLVIRPAFIATLITAAGCATFMLSTQASIREIGIVLPAGIAASFCFSLFFVPTAYRVLSGSWQPRYQHPVKSATTVPAPYTQPLCIALLGLLIGSVCVLPGLKINPDATDFFHQDSELSKTYHWIENHLSGQQVIDMVIYSRDAKLLTSPEHQRQLQTLVQALQQTPDLVTVVSVLPWITTDRTHQAFHPTISELQKILLTQDHKMTRLSLQFRAIDGPDYTNIETALRQVWINADTQGLEMRITGLSALIQNSQQLLLLTQATVLPIVLLITCLLLFLIIRSFKALGYACLASFIPLIMVGGAMVTLNMAINPVNLCIASVLFGLVISNTVHILYTWRQRGSLALALHEIRPALWSSSVTIGLSFITLLLSGLVPIVQLSVLSVITIICAFLCHVYLLPWMMQRARKHASAKLKQGFT